MASFSRVSIPFFIMLPFLFFSSSETREFLVGGSQHSWTLPLPSPDSLNHWAQNHRFRIGDALMFPYDQRSETVLQVKEEDYESCNISEPIKEYSDGDSKVELERSGAFYFISGAEGHCEKGLKLAVEVMADGHGGGRHHSPAPAPSPSLGMPPLEGVAASVGGGLVMGLGVSLMILMMV